MTDREQYAQDLAKAARFSRLWSGHVDALDRHLSTNMWTHAVVLTLVLTAYPIARIVIPLALHAVVPDAVRTLLNLI